MFTIEKPKSYVLKLWGKQNINTRTVYRLMKYVIRVDSGEITALHNTISGELVVLNSKERKLLNEIPMGFSGEMESLIRSYFLVPNDYDEHKRVLELRLILRKYHKAKNNSLNRYVILPTTACNARCYYCFERGVESKTMTEQTADDIVDFISNHCKRKVANIQWFGGEPTVAANRIDQICNGLKSNGIEVISSMISNGYLFDEEMVLRAKELWNLTSLQISIDGVEENYNRIKAYVNANENPYRRIIDNVSLLLNQNINVTLRMNIDITNYKDYQRLAQELLERFSGDSHLKLCAYPIIGEHVDSDGNLIHADSQWMEKKIVELNDFSRKVKLRHLKRELPALRYTGCSADDNTCVVITPFGDLVTCMEQFEDDQVIGNVKVGIINHALTSSWEKISNYEKCVECKFFPTCVRLSNCTARDNCYLYDRNRQFILSIQTKIDKYIQGGFKDVF